MQALNIKGQTDQIPFAFYLPVPAQRELAKAQHLLDNPDHWLDCAFAQAVDRFAEVSPEFVGHLLFGAGRFRGRRGLLLEVFPPTLVMGFAPSGNIRLNTALLSL